MKKHLIDQGHRRQLGRRLTAFCLNSPAVIQVLKELRQKGIKIRIVDGYCRAYYNRKQRTIIIARSCSLEYKAITIAHEYSHALVKPTIDPIPGVTGRQEFIDRCIDEETESIIQELKAVRDLIKAGIDLKDDLWYRRFRYGGGRANIRRWVEETITSTTGETYPVYYGLWYDEVIPQDKRLP